MSKVGRQLERKLCFINVHLASTKLNFFKTKSVLNNEKQSCALCMLIKQLNEKPHCFSIKMHVRPYCKCTSERAVHGSDCMHNIKGIH